MSESKTALKFNLFILKTQRLTDDHIGQVEGVLDKNNIVWSCLTYGNYEKFISSWGNTLAKLIANMFMKMKIIECILLSLANQLFCYHWLIYCTKKEHKISKSRYNRKHCLTLLIWNYPIDYHLGRLKTYKVSWNQMDIILSIFKNVMILRF